MRVYGDGQRRVGGNVCLSQRLAVAGKATGHRRQCLVAAQDGDAGVAAVEQIACRCIACPHVVGLYGRSPRLRRAAVDKDGRDVMVLEFGIDGQVGAGGRDEHAVDATLEQQVQVVGFLLGLLVGAADDQAAPLLPEQILHAADDTGEKGVEHVGHDDAHGVGAPRGQAAGDGAGAVVEPPRGVEHGLAGCFGDGPRVVEDMRNRRRTHVGRARYIANGRHRLFAHKREFGSG